MNFGVYIGPAIGFNVGKTAHHACPMPGSGEIVYGEFLSQREPKLLKVYTVLKQHGTVLLVVD